MNVPRKIWPLYFRFFLPSATDDEGVRRVDALFQYAQRAGFAPTQLYDLCGEQCIIFPGDKLYELKVIARLVVHPGGDEAVSRMPDRILAFGVRLPNGITAWFGLAAFRISSDSSLPDKPDDSPRWLHAWEASVQTIPSTCCEKEAISCVENAVRSHETVIDILRQADGMKILDRIFDPTAFWECDDADHLKRTTANVYLSRCMSVSH